MKIKATNNFSLIMKSLQRVFMPFMILTLTLGVIATSAQNSSIDSLKLILKNTSNDSLKCIILTAITDQTGDAEILYDCNQQKIKICEKNISISTGTKKTFFLEALSAALNNQGYATNMRGKVMEALSLFERALKLNEQIGNKNGAAIGLNNIAVIYDNQGNVPKALEYFHKGLKRLEEMGDNVNEAAVLNNIGNIYKRQKELKTAMDYYQKSLKLSQAVNDKRGIANSLNSIGQAHGDRGDQAKALEFYEKSFKMREEMGDKIMIAQSLNNIGFVYNKMDQSEKAIDYFKRSLILFEEIGDKKGQANTLDNLAKVYLKNNQLAQAYTYASRSLVEAKAVGSPQTIRNSATTLKKLFQKQNKYKEAFEMFELQVKMNDSIDNQENRKTAIRKDLQYQFEKKEFELKAEQDKKDLLAKEALKQKEKERNYFIGGFALVILLAVFILRGYLQKRKANTIITEQNILVKTKQKEILDSIRYAKRIQQAHLPTENYIARNLNKLNKK